jgi:aminopeptidase-like protein
MANNELSGPLALAFLYKEIAKLTNRKYSYRFVLAPETIGIVTFLHEYGDSLINNLKAGYVLTCCGDLGDFTYKRSRQMNSLADRAAEHVLRYGHKHEVINFSVGGSDERQYCAPGFNLPVGSLMRTMYQRYPEYHTSLDNKKFISFEKLEETVDTYLEIVKLLEINDHYETKVKYCEPQLGKRGLYPSSVNPEDDRRELHNLLHLLAFADGEKDLIEIAEARPCSALEFESAIRKCQQQGLL